MASKLEVLIKIATELNEKFGLDPAIDVELKATPAINKPAKLKTAILAECKGTLSESDKELLTTETWDYLTGDLGVVPVEAPATEVPPAAEKSAKEKKEKEEKPAKEPKAKAPKKEKAPRDFSTSNKAIVYKQWKKKPSTTVEELEKLVEGRVKANTIKAWTNQWKNGKNLPAIAKA